MTTTFNLERLNQDFRNEVHYQLWVLHKMPNELEYGKRAFDDASLTTDEQRLRAIICTSFFRSKVYHRLWEIHGCPNADRYGEYAYLKVNGFTSDDVERRRARHEAWDAIGRLVVCITSVASQLSSKEQVTDHTWAVTMIARDKRLGRKEGSEGMVAELLKQVPCDLSVHFHAQLIIETLSEGNQKTYLTQFGDYGVKCQVLEGPIQAERKSDTWFLPKSRVWKMLSAVITDQHAAHPPKFDLLGGEGYYNCTSWALKMIKMAGVRMERPDPEPYVSPLTYTHPC